MGIQIDVFYLQEKGFLEYVLCSGANEDSSSKTL
jgi:hypothetical protein